MQRAALIVTLLVIAAGIILAAVFDGALPHEHAVRSLPRREGAATDFATFAAGCFWGVEADFRTTPGVVQTTVGYTGGWTHDPTYREVCTGKTGHAEAVRVEYDPQRVSYDTLLAVFWAHQNPRQLEAPPDRWAESRSAIFYANSSQRSAAERSAAALARKLHLSLPIVTTIQAATVFYPAESYQQQYLEKHGQTVCHIAPRVTTR